MADPDLQRNASADPDLQRNASALSFLQSIELTSCPIKCDTIDTRCDDETPTISPEPRSNSSPGENGSKIKIQVTPVPESASETISAAYAFLNSIPLTRDESFTENGAERGADVMSPPSKKSSGDLDDPEAAAAAFFDGIPLHRLESMDDSNASGSPGGSVSGSMSDSGASLHPPGHAMRHSNSLQRHSRRQFTGFLLPATSATSKRSRMQARNLKQKESVDDKHDSREHDTKPEAVSRQSSTVLALDDVNVSERQYVLLSTREVSESRLRLSTPRMSIVCSFSFLGYRGQAKLSDVRESQLKEESELNMTQRKWTSYEWLCNRGDSDSDDGHIHSSNRKYNPYFVDDPEMRWGKHRTVLALPFMMASMIPYVRQKELKQELNEQFCLKHPDLPHNLTLSKIRRLKELQLNWALPAQEFERTRARSNEESCRQEWLHHIRETNLELATVAMSYIYLEKLVLKKYVTKQNRRTVACACLLLAAKFNDMSKPEIMLLLGKMEEEFNIPPKVILADEFSTYVALDFELHVEVADVLSHIVRILQTQELKPNEYYTAEMAQTYFSGRTSRDEAAMTRVESDVSLS